MAGLDDFSFELIDSTGEVQVANPAPEEEKVEWVNELNFW
jgi:hypothetical protein